MRLHFQSNSPARQLRGFTLPEVMVSAAVTLLVLLGLFGGISYGFSVTQISRENLRATQIILERMEGIRLYTYDQLITSNMFSTNFTASYYPFVTNTNESKGLTYYGTMTFTDPGTLTYYNPNIRMVTVSVAWTNSYGTSRIARSRSMQTLVGRWGIQNYTYFN